MNSAVSTSNSCCNLPNGEHKCEQCGGQSRIYRSLAHLEEHCNKRSHDDANHGFFFDATSGRAAATGVSKTVAAEKGDDVDDDEGGDRLSRLEAQKKRAADTEAPPAKKTKKKKLKKRANDDDDDVDDKKDDDVDADVDDAEMRAEIDRIADEQAAKTTVVVAEVVAASKATQLKRRGKAATIDFGTGRVPSSVWLSCGKLSKSESKQPGRNGSEVVVVTCSVCRTSVVLNATGSSSNMKNHYEAEHKALFNKVVAAKEQKLSAAAIVKLFEDAAAVAAAQRSAATPKASIKDKLVSTSKSTTTPSPSSGAPAAVRVPKELYNRVASVLYAAATNTSLEQIGSHIHAGYIEALGGSMVDKSKSPLDAVLPLVYDAVCSDMCDGAQDGHLACDSWTTMSGESVTGMTVTFAAENWQLVTRPVGFMQTGDMTKTSENQCEVMRQMVNQATLGDRFNIHTTVTDNEASVAKAADLFTCHQGAVRCVVHTMALVAKVDVLEQKSHVPEISYINAALERITEIVSYTKNRPKLESKLCADQVKRDHVTLDRVRTFKYDCATRWYGVLIVMEQYLALHDNVVRVFDDWIDSGAAGQAPVSPPVVLNAGQLTVLAEVIVVLREFRRVGRALEAESTVTASRAPRLLWELYETLKMWHDQNYVAGGAPRLSAAGDDTAKLVARDTALRQREARVLAGALADAMLIRLGHLWKMGVAAVGREYDDAVDAGDAPTYLLHRRAVLFHMAAMLDVNECSLDFLPSSESAGYYKLMIGCIALDHAANMHTKDGHVVSDDGIASARYACSNLHIALLADLNKHGRREPEWALQWWREAPKRQDVQMFEALLRPTARALLSMLASSAPAERLFSDAGNLEGGNRHNAATATMEMFLIIRRFVLSELNGANFSPDTSDIMPMSAEAQAFTRLVTSIASKIVRTQSAQ